MANRFRPEAVVAANHGEVAPPAPHMREACRAVGTVQPRRPLAGLRRNRLKMIAARALPLAYWRVQLPVVTGEFEKFVEFARLKFPRSDTNESTCSRSQDSSGMA